MDIEDKTIVIKTDRVEELLHKLLHHVEDWQRETGATGGEISVMFLTVGVRTCMAMDMPRDVIDTMIERVIDAHFPPAPASADRTN